MSHIIYHIKDMDFKVTLTLNQTLNGDLHMI